MPSETPSPSTVGKAAIALLIGGDDQKAAALGAILTTMGIDLLRIRSAAAALEFVYDRCPSIVLIDDDLEDLPAVALMRQLHAARPSMAMTTLGRISAHFGNAGEARAVLHGILESHSPALGHSGTIARDVGRIRFVRMYRSLFRRGPRTRDLEQAVGRAAKADAAVLITGESGAGKKVLARAIHYLSARAAKPGIVIESPISEPLFGTWVMMIEQAAGGTLIVDEIADLAPDLQANLLPLTENSDVRLITTTSKDILAAVRAGQLRRDLFGKIGAITIEVPALRDRVEEIAGLAEFFRAQFTERSGRHTAPLSSAAIRHLTEYAWPGNIVELENLMRRYVAVGDEAQLIAELRARSRVAASGTRRKRRASPASTSLRDIGQRAADEAQMAAILKTLEQVQWNRAEAARLLNVSYKTLLNKLNRAGIPGRTRPSRDP